MKSYDPKSPEEALKSRWPTSLMGKDDIFMGTVIKVNEKEHLIVLRGTNKAAKTDVWWFKVPGELWEDALALDQEARLCRGLYGEARSLLTPGRDYRSSSRHPSHDSRPTTSSGGVLRTNQMPSYNSTPWITPVRMIQEPQLPNYSLGAKNPNQADTRMQVTNTVLVANVATVTAQMLEGNIPIVGQTVTIVGTTNGGGAFNVTGTVATVGAFSASGLGTFTVAITHADVATHADAGTVYGGVPETADAITATASPAASQTGLQFSVSRMQHRQQGSNFSWAYKFPSAPASITIQLEGAINDVDNEYSVIDKPTSAVLTAGGETRPVTLPENVNFVRVKIPVSSGGTLPTVIAKILG